MTLFVFLEKNVIHQLYPTITIESLRRIKSLYSTIFRIGSQYDQT